MGRARQPSRVCPAEEPQVRAQLVTAAWLGAKRANGSNCSQRRAQVNHESHGVARRSDAGANRVSTGDALQPAWNGALRHACPESAIPRAFPERGAWRPASMRSLAGSIGMTEVPRFRHLSCWRRARLDASCQGKRLRRHARRSAEPGGFGFAGSRFPGCGQGRSRSGMAWKSARWSNRPARCSTPIRARGKSSHSRGAGSTIQSDSFGNGSSIFVAPSSGREASG